MANNSVSQTLFRFVSLRNPQLTETKDDNLGFIHRPVGLASFFDSYINPEDPAILKFQALEKAVKDFDNAGYETELKIEQGEWAEVLKIGRKIARREEMTPEDEAKAISLYDSTSEEQFKILWDNLIFQTVNQSNFYVKEALIHILKALHFGYACKLQPTNELKRINGEEFKNKALEGKVVLPLKFFGDGYEGEDSSEPSEESNAFKVNVSKIGKGMINGGTLPVSVRQQLKVAGELITNIQFESNEKDELLQLRTELEKIEELFYKIKTKEYNSSYKEYLEVNKEIIELYNTKLNEINTKIDNGASQEEIDALYEELDRIKVPVFDFTYKNELNFEDLNARLSENLFKLFVQYFTLINNGNPLESELDFSTIEFISDKEILISGIPITITDEYDTFVEVYNKLDKDVSDKSQYLIAKSNPQQTEYVRIGSVLVPRSATNYAEISGTYFLSFTNNNGFRNYVSFYYNTNSNSLGLLSANVEIKSSDSDSIQRTISSIDVVDGKVIFPLVLNSLNQNLRNVKITLYFQNGEYTTIEHNVSITEVYTGIFVFKTDEGGEDPGDNPGINPPGTFTPKHFGVKRLGIADYLKVEQSVHAYVPGEVSNIENVMASELRHKSSVERDYSEIIDTTSEYMETEKISDTSKADRNEMQTEVAKEIDKDQSIEAHTSFRAGGKAWSMEVGGSYANNTAQRDSTRQAVSKSQELTERAMERVLIKVSKKRIQKIIKEFTETNVHEFDNRGKADGGDTHHITGVYRWVDKKMKNQIYNYGKRTMFEFMIPEPARLHNLAVSRKDSLIPPEDPRKKGLWQIIDYKTATKEQLQYWAQIYGVKLEEFPPQNITEDQFHDDRAGAGDWEMRNVEIPVSQNYKCTSYNVHYSYKESRSRGKIKINNSGELLSHEGDISFQANTTVKFTITYFLYHIELTSFKITKYCVLSDEFIESWKKEVFDKIIAAYEEAYAVFLQKQEELDQKAKEEEEANKERISQYYRDIESVILKHNCIAYLLQDYLTLGQSLTVGDKMDSFKVLLGDDLEKYTSLAKFMEQAFEWNIMDYTFYPYYWGNSKNWQDMYMSESTDPLFRSFLQAGMARVIVTVKPGFEDAVQFFMSTGKIWNGGEVPVIGDPLYMSIVDELRQPTGDPQGNYWITRIPTTLTILQAESVGLKVEQPLPIFPEPNPENCENPLELESETSFFKEDIRMEGTGDDKTTLPKTIIG